MHRSRLAPSPTGSLHLGNVCSFILNWALARSRHWELIYRLEDLCTGRIQEDAATNVLVTFRWLGIDWDGEMHVQSEDLTPYVSALEELRLNNMIYHCNLTRKQIEHVSVAPQENDKQADHPIRPKNIQQHNQLASDVATNWRLIADNTSTIVEDHIQGNVEIQIQDDFVVWTKEGVPSYQLAVVVDDHHQGVTEVVRANDLLESASRQMMLYRAMGWQIPTWWHLPLVIGPDGRKLAKRHGDTRVLFFRDQGVTPEKLIGLIGYWCSFIPQRKPMSLPDFLHAFDFTLIPRDTITCTKEDLTWLLDS